MVLYASGLGRSCTRWLYCVPQYAEHVQTSSVTLFIENSYHGKYLSPTDLVLLINFQISATGAGALGLGAALVEILAQEMRTCHKFHVWDTRQQSHSIDRRQEYAAMCCGCIQQDANISGTDTPCGRFSPFYWLLSGFQIIDHVALFVLAFSWVLCHLCPIGCIEYVSSR